jgi:acyl-CoA dehydrogenase
VAFEASGRTGRRDPITAAALSLIGLGTPGLAGRLAADDPARWSESLARVAAGELLLALAVDEGAKHRAGGFACRAIPAGDGYTLEGEKTFVVDGHVAGLLIVAARVDVAGGAPGVALLVVEPGQAGVGVERTMMVDAHNAARVRFSAVQVTAVNVLVGPARGAAALEAVLDAGRAALAAELVGAGEEAFERTMTYLKERKQFGRTIGEFQALQHRAAVLYTDLELARAATMKALRLVDAGGPDAVRWASVAKSKASAAAGLAAQEGVQMHGGMGMTDAFDIGLFMKRVRVAQELLGDAAFHADRLARLNGY